MYNFQGQNNTYVSSITEIRQVLFIIALASGNLKVAIINILYGVYGHHKVEIGSILCAILIPNINEIHEAVLE